MPLSFTRRTLGCLALLATTTVGCSRSSSPSAEQRESAPPSASASGGSGTKGSTTQSASSANAATPLDGAQLYAKYCALCHGRDGQGYAADNAPSLVSPSFLESATDAFIADGIRLGRSGTAMAAYSKERGGPLSDAEIRSIVAFLRSKGPAAKALASGTTPGDAKRGAELYGKECVSCHGTEHSRANAIWLFSPELLRTASNGFLRHAITHGRPPTAMQPFGDKLGERGVEDLVAYLTSKAPQTPAAAPKLNLESLKDLPLVINPDGATPSFTLRANRFVSVDQVKQALDKKQRMIIIDARSPSDFIQSRIPGAISNGYYDREGLDRLKDDGTWIIAYCACPHHASGEVVDELRRRGFKRTAVLDEGILEWQHRGYPIVGESHTPVPAPPAPNK